MNPPVFDAGKPPTVCIDFDAVIHPYLGWDGPAAAGGPPIQGAARALRVLRDAGFRLEVFTSRPAPDVESYLDEHGLLGLFDAVRDGKPYYGALFDDRAYHVMPNQADGLRYAVRDWLRRQKAKAGMVGR